MNKRQILHLALLLASIGIMPLLCYLYSFACGYFSVDPAEAFMYELAVPAILMVILVKVVAAPLLGKMSNRMTMVSAMAICLATLASWIFLSPENFKSYADGFETAVKSDPGIAKLHNWASETIERHKDGDLKGRQSGEFFELDAGERPGFLKAPPSRASGRE